MTAVALKALTRVSLREIWQYEAHSFTPWLAQKESLTQLGEAVGLNLSLEVREKNVGPFKADLLCKDDDTDRWVLIENQLEKTDHTHLGQIITYASGLEAVTVVWLAEKFTEEHRAALDWLNEVTNGKVSFLGVEVEVWRIGDSAPAVHFNVVSKPNDWSKRVSDAADSIMDGELGETKQKQLEFWTALRVYWLESKSSINPQKPLPQHWTTYAIGRSGANIAAAVHLSKQLITVILSLTSNAAKKEFKLLFQQREAIEREVGASLVWDELPEGKESRIKIYFEGADFDDRSRWQEYHTWIKQTVELFYQVFGARVRELAANLRDDG